MRRISWYKILKIAVGCALALLTSQTIGLQYYTSVITITLLSIQNTRKDTLRVAWKRTCAFTVALAISLAVFPLMRYSPAAIGVYLLLFVFICQWLRIEDGLAMSTVLMTHLWSSKGITWPAVLNEMILMSIGIAMGIVMNLYMPKQIDAIKADQRRIEDSMRGILSKIAEAVLRQYDPDTIERDLQELQALLSESRKRAFVHVNNTFNRDMRYYLQYMDMRREQYAVLRRMADALPRLRSVPGQSHVVASFIRMTSYSLHEYNNAADLLEQLAEIRRYFRNGELPVTREEFEARAVLYEIVNELHRLLQLKQDFSHALSPSQIRTFWKSAAESDQPNT